ncbi:hypothetical protein [Abyssicoccus albus]|uniref:Uncharacterized protein n=1 Tax=Abyssicoccus albus TaxID=1817405 RepID=A0A3N5BI67_9BACL|nr:hypothetical protein [Abyssicoccus albus]RPF57516.1 hypothetical protein EDD62_0137 [Abyssicoccus albus]
MNKSQMQNDIESDEEIVKFLDQFLYPTLEDEFYVKFERANNLDDQHSGIDLRCFYNENESFNIDEKTAAHYFKDDLSNPGLSTFALEVMYFKDDKAKDGWLFGNKYNSTDTYIFNWGWTEKGYNKKNKIHHDKIVKIESMHINKNTLKEYLQDRYQINKENVLEVYESLKGNNNKGNRLQISNNSDLNAYFMLSNQYNEKPLNIIMPKKELSYIANTHLCVYKDEPPRFIKTK